MQTHFSFFDDVPTFTEEEIKAMGNRSLEEGLPLTSEVSSVHRSVHQILLGLHDEGENNNKKTC